MNVLILTPIPNTPYVTLANDANLTPTALREGTILLEKQIAELPEVKALGPEDFVLDVGAFIGDTALIFGLGGAEVWAFEPQRDAYLAAIINTHLNRNKIQVFPWAIGNFEQVETNQNPIAGNLGTRTVSPSDSGLRTKRLDTLLYPKPVTFLKIDVEGFEPAVLRGAMGLLTSYKPTVLVEIYPELLALHVALNKS